MPLRLVHLSALGINSLAVEIPLWIQTDRGNFAPTRFLLDTAANVSEVSVEWARLAHIPINGPRRTVPVLSGGGSGLWSGWFGTLRVSLPLWSATEYEWPCFFREQRPPKLPPQLGLAGILNDLRMSLDGTPTASAPYGHLLVEEYPAPATPQTP